MTVKLSTTNNYIQRDVVNSENKEAITRTILWIYEKSSTSERYQNNNLIL